MRMELYMSRLLSPKKNQPNHDLIFTPSDLAYNIIQHYKPSGKILDPAYGTGSFYNYFPTNDKYWCEIEQGLDFFDFNTKVDWIITNPPWSKIRQFILHGMKLSDNIVYLATINHFTTKARLRDLKDDGFAIKEIYGVGTPKNNWPSSGFQLAAVHLIKSKEFIPIIMSGVFGE